MKCRSSLDWILTALSGLDVSNICEMRFIDPTAIDNERSTVTPTESIAPKAEPSAELYAKLTADFDYRYPYLHLSRVPAKISVSRLSPDVLDERDDTLNLFDTDKKASVPRILLSNDKESASATARGTSTHLFLQFCDFARVERTSIKQELDCLIGKGYLSPEVRTLVRESELARFFQSDFYRSLRGARQVWRETRFHIFLPASDFTQDPALRTQLGEERLAVQGVIDLFFYNAAGELLLCDYKTDRLSDAERRSPALAAKMLGGRHGEQLSYYAKALREICGRAPDRVLIYSLPLGEAVEIPVKSI
jgi:ATP-dependent exoDNAse (exonuclease V) beta subunit